jgi:ABC-2 type transport system ATP-binding protein
MNSAAPVEFPIALQNVTRRFGQQVAVDDVSLKLTRGQTFGFIGLNGAGKTTTIRMMVGLLAPTSGAILIEGHSTPLHRDKIKPTIGYVPDRPTIYPWMRIEEALEFARSFYGNWNDLRCMQLLKALELDRRKKIRHLSKGQAAKVSLLLAICHEPSVLILDEPTSGLDPLAREEFLEGVLAVTGERQQTVLFSSHTLADVQRLADRVGLMHEGKLLLNSPVSELLEKTKRIRAVLEDEFGSHESPPGSICQQVRGREWVITVENYSQDQIEFIRAKNRISHLDVEDLSLDDVFKDIVRSRRKEVLS